MNKVKVNHIKKAIEEDIVRNISILETDELSKDCLIVKPANKWIEEAKKRPIPNMLFSELWYEGELSILYADTNVGKSILAVQIGESVSSGIPIDSFKLEAKAQRVLYLDFELSDKQFEKRYSNEFTNHYQFHPNFFRAEINPLAKIPKDFKNMEEYLCSQLGTLIVKYQAEVVIVDNLTFLNNDSEKAKYALELMKQLKRITKECHTSILVLAHTPKRDESKPISMNDLAGSKMLINFCDSAFALGFSQHEPSHRYIKQIKQRNTEHIYHVNNVIICCLEKQQNFLQFRFLYYDSEINHLRNPSKTDLEERDDQMKGMIQEGMSNVKIGEALGISEAAVRKRRKILGI
ncbi:AAA family ATPase [Maribacter aurantiacus]|uniref:LuxR family transcriptional regulator n=1 Tax=Maribacter aurantiacus TaxID=1882343 RepID=A0A5R8MC29_9FLAO|nr:AAA family ATPase [Maribacter aurantiacus]TLF47118.1 LuxR family transcriptional regulator [Maribacter aurantiacus]